MLVEPPVVLPDTNYLIDYPQILDEAWQLRPLHILISDVVMAELAGLSNNSNRFLAENSELPGEALPKVPLHQLIILAPLRPMPEIQAVVDWTLAHTSARDALEIDLLYVADTPEELAMFEVAEACFDLRYAT
jgi:hypothetical protein